MRKYLRIILVLAFLTGLGSVGALVARSMWQQHRKELLLTGLEILPGVSQHIQDFRRVKMKDGRKVWEVAAADARYFDETNTVVVRGAVLSWYLEDGRRIGLEGDEGRIELEHGDVARVELAGGIQVFLADYQVRAESAVYDRASDQITAPGEVEISGEALHLRGRGMHVHVKNQTLSLEHNVSMVMQPALLRGSHPKT
jgi:LPS export ABC transporter protein LptC